MKKAPMSNVVDCRQEMGEVYYDLSGPVTARIGGKKYAAHLIDTNTTKSDVVLLRSKVTRVRPPVTFEPIYREFRGSIL